ncbi:MAG TPA: hypothetical protein VJW51_00015 [Candidatus Acidoferrales bacterium]|nr:hypothetical protein [Candidatus Acidoferrales bacterium]
MSETPEKTTGSKKAYEPPQIVRVSLRPEEAVLGNCKFLGMSGPASSSCASLVCRSLGS